MSIVKLHVVSTATKVGSERRFDKGITILELKGKLEMITGASSAAMELRLQDAEGNDIATLEKEDAMLGAYPVQDYLVLKVIDHDGQASIGKFDDVTQVDKYEMEDDKYGAIRGTVRDFKQRNKIGRFNPEFVAAQEAAAEEKDREGEEKAKGMKVGDRCEVKIGGTRRGEVMYVGKTDFQQGWWVGVKYDEPLGKNNGTVKGQKYFECPDKYGGFVRPDALEVGDFPEEDLLDFSDDEM
mmetsp:Transcript_37224/g.97603  ORF Transcript_37224/g.97603 Transcript_37224/m.97603 type:complete len:240 (+) Transcript_37224:50-769(+)|eukprot:CAMPEP_0182926826 /NCGR_PEP_ID=MMETSP0105_2-20130417/12333_1 /TAXON_ID=81532 ORGANISM="Acanthoeca-like sp., Strain 10tr" /NCGR_SAMPLE_ID=MMETSP0105_2 /ASSEMBLY_ACC=CAM_ASM_000205 /LENGTH=239 /DNA_ID=CAMNT_0025064737 /DNA_START=40 /DNA_END=759 /DNA_ORIENTATION=-